MTGQTLEKLRILTELVKYERTVPVEQAMHPNQKK